MCHFLIRPTLSPFPIVSLYLTGVCVWLCMWVYGCSQGSEVSDVLELELELDVIHRVSAGNWAPVSWKSKAVLMTADSSL